MRGVGAFVLRGCAQYCAQCRAPTAASGRERQEGPAVMAAAASEPPLTFLKHLLKECDWEKSSDPSARRGHPLKFFEVRHPRAAASEQYRAAERAAQPG